MRKGGFTLIELLVVVAIIGVLSSIVLSSLNSARAKGRDARRLSDLKQIQAALEMYYSDNGSYPIGTGWRGTCSTFGSYAATGATGYIPNLAPTYISQLPREPQETSGFCYLYRSDSTGSEYMFLVYRTVEGNVPVSLQRPNYPSEKDYAIYTPGASTW